MSVTADKTSLTYGEDAPNLTAAATKPEGSTDEVTYQWYQNGEKIENATSSTYIPDSLNAGEYAYTCTATADGYSLTSESVAIKVNPFDITGKVVVTMPYPSVGYKGSKLYVTTLNVTLDDVNLKYETEFVVLSGDEGKDVGNYTLIVEGVGNYTGTAQTTWSITPATLTVTGWAIEKAYDGTTDITLNAEDVVLYGKCGNDDVMVDASDVTAQFADAAVGESKDVTYTGSFALTGESAKNYTLAVQPTLIGTITKRPVSVTPDSLTKEYGADDPALTYMLTSGTLVEGHTLTLKRVAGEDIGSYAIDQYTIKDADGKDVTGNYDVTLEAVDFQITKPDFATATVMIGQDSYIYDGTAKEPAVTVVKDGQTVASSEYDVTYSDNVNVGTATVTVTAREGGNYYGSNSTATFTITPTSISGAVVEPADSLMYSGKVQEQKVTVTIGDVELTEGTDYTLSGNTGTDAGTYILTVSGTGNYTDSVEQEFTIAKANVMVYIVSVADRAYEPGNTDVEVKITFNGYGVLNAIRHTATAKWRTKMPEIKSL